MSHPDARAAAPAAATVSTAAVAGAPLRQLAVACPRCGAPVPSPASDFCEHCSAHLYPGHCVFCLEPFAPGQAHCRQCGLPPEGVICGACGTFSRFDFCPNPDCGAGLTPRAAAELERLGSDPEAVQAFAELDEIGTVLAELSRPAPLPEAAPVERVTAQAAPQPAAPPASAGATRPSLAALRAAAREARSAEEKAKVRALAEQAAQDALLSVSTRTFPSAQEARAAGNALQVALRFREVSQKLEVIAWRCNAFSCEHPMPAGMALCSDPSRGGVPVTRVIEEIVEGNAEFTV
ncbi:MAG TPA: zinc ribbon domain-containing protein [Gemmatimonadales bacterium]|nr:zinc ribbon domain-containing protein [Gemmatimonadales bacterium]